MNLPNPADVIGIGSAPRSANRAWIAGSASDALITVLSFSTTCGGVLLGAPMPYQLPAS
jgi:hypothetical protein